MATPQTFTVETRKGTQTFNSSLSAEQVLNGLSQLGKSNDFAASLARTRRWSPKQEAWAHKLVLDAQAQAAKVAPVAPAPAAPAAPALKMDGIARLFGEAQGKLQKPRVTFVAPGNRTVRLELVAWGSLQGCISITDGERYGRRYGIINERGEYRPGRNACEDVLDILKEIDANPAETLARLAQADGKCCFCRHDLVDENSTVWGYGPVCAKTWNLPHGVDKVPVYPS